MDGAAGPGRQVTLKDVADRAGVSSATVSRVLNDNYPVAESTRERVMEAVRHYDYVVNVHAQALVHSRSGVIGIVVADVSDPFFSEIVRGAQQVASEAGRMAMICSSGGDPQRELQYVTLLRTHRADAVLLVGAGSERADDQDELARQADGMARQGSRLVLVGRPAPQGTDAASVVQVDNTGAGLLLAEHLTGLGHRRILFLAGPAERTSTTARLGGFLRAARSRRVARTGITVLHGDLSRGSGRRLVQQALQGSTDFTAVAASNDLMAIGALRELRDAGLQVPQDVSVMGVDDVPGAADVTPGLTTVRLPLHQMGAEGAELALETMGPRLLPVLAVHLVERGSTASPPVR